MGEWLLYRLAQLLRQLRFRRLQRWLAKRGSSYDGAALDEEEAQP